MALISRWWSASVLYAALRAVFGFVRRAAADSRVLAALFGPSRLDGAYARSRTARLLSRAVHAALGCSAVLVRWAKGSRICRVLAPAVRSARLLRYENLFSMLLCIMFIVPHDNWNNLYGAIIAVALLALYLLECAKNGREVPGPGALGFGFFLFVLSALLSMGFTTAPADSLRILVLFLSAFLLCWLVAVRFDRPEALRRLLGAMYLCLFIACAMAIAQRVLGLVTVNPSQTDTRINAGVPGRVYGPLDNPNNLSAFIQLFLPLSAAYAGTARTRRSRVLLALGLAVPILALLMTYSRSGWLAIAVAAVVFVWCLNWRLVPVLLLLALALLPLMPQSVLTRLSTITNAKDSSRLHRFAIWQGVLDLLRDYWVTGIGLGSGSFLKVYPDYAYPQGLRGAFHSQMLYLELDLEFGILGAVSFLWMYLKYAGRFARSIARKSGTRLILVAALSTLAGFAVSGLVEYQWYYQRCIFAFFLFFGIGAAAVRAAEREAPVSAEPPPEKPER